MNRVALIVGWIVLFFVGARVVPAVADAVFKAIDSLTPREREELTKALANRIGGAERWERLKNERGAVSQAPAVAAGM